MASPRPRLRRAARNGSGRRAPENLQLPARPRRGHQRRPGRQRRHHRRDHLDPQLHGEPNAAIYSARTAGTFAKLKTGLVGDKTQLIMPREVAALQHLVTNQIPDDIGGAESEIIVGDYTKLVVGVRETVNVRVARMPKLDTMQYELLAYVRADVALLEPNHFYVVRGVQAA